MRTLGDLLRCDHCGGSLTFIRKTYRGVRKATYDCEECGIRYELECVRDSRLLGEKWEKVKAERIQKPPPEEKPKA